MGPRRRTVVRRRGHRPDGNWECPALDVQTSGNGRTVSHAAIATSKAWIVTLKMQTSQVLQEFMQFWSSFHFVMQLATSLLSLRCQLKIWWFAQAFSGIWCQYWCVYLPGCDLTCLVFSNCIVFSWPWHGEISCDWLCNPSANFYMKHCRETVFW